MTESLIGSARNQSYDIWVFVRMLGKRERGGIKRGKGGGERE